MHASTRVTVIAVLALAASCLLAPTAHADTYLVAAPSATGNDTTCTPCATVQGALTKANNHAGADVVSIPAGTYTGELTLSSGEDSIVGAGAGATILEDDDNDATPLLDYPGPGSVSNLSLLGSGTYVVWIEGGSLHDVTIAAAPAHTVSYLVSTESSSSPLRIHHATLTQELLSPPRTAILDAGGTNQQLFDHLKVTGGNGIGIDMHSPVVVRDSWFDTSTTGIFSDAGGTLDLTVQDSVFRVLPETSGPGGSVAAGIEIAPTSTLDGSAVIDGVTLWGSPSVTASHGLELQASTSDSYAVTVRSSVFDGFASDVYSTVLTGMPTATVTVGYSRLDAGNEHGFDGGGADFPVTSGGGTITTSPAFVNAAGGNFHPASGSPLVDAGTPGALPAGRPTVDYRGAARLVDGLRTGTRRIDMGAYEVQSVPRAATRPHVVGTMRVGKRIRCALGTWVGGTGTYRLHWYRGSTRLKATSLHYRIVRRDAGKRLSCSVTWTSDDATATVRSAARRVARLR